MFARLSLFRFLEVGAAGARNLLVWPKDQPQSTIPWSFAFVVGCLQMYLCKIFSHLYPPWGFGLIIALLLSAHLLLLKAASTSLSWELPTLQQAHCVTPPPENVPTQKSYPPFRNKWSEEQRSKNIVLPRYVWSQNIWSLGNVEYLSEEYKPLYVSCASK